MPVFVNTTRLTPDGVPITSGDMLTIGSSVDAAAWWFITMERSCQAQLLAEAAGTPRMIPADVARSTGETVGSELAGWFNFQPLFEVISHEQPELFG